MRKARDVRVRAALRVRMAMRGVRGIRRVPEGIGVQVWLLVAAAVAAGWRVRILDIVVTKKELCRLVPQTKVK